MDLNVIANSSTMVNCNVTASLCLATALLVGVLWTMRRSKGKKYRLPPGPSGHFLFGNTFRNWFNKDFLEQCADQYGPIFSLTFLSKRIVVVSTFESIKEAYGNDALSGRIQSPFVKDLTENGHGLVMSEGPLWKEQRRFTLSVLKDFGLGRNKIESTIRDELVHLRQSVAALQGRPFWPSELFLKAVSNVINSIVFNERLSEDPEFDKFVGMTRKLATFKPEVVFFSFFWPLLKKLKRDVTGLQDVLQSRNYVRDYASKRFFKHRESFDPSNIRDYIDAYLLEAQKRGDSTFTETQACQAVFELFLAGSETTSSTLLWAVVFLAKYPDVQRRCHAEIDRELGDSKLPESADRVKLRYTDATIHEVQRYVTLAPQGMPHKALADTEACGFDIPKDSIVIANLLYANRRAEYWKDPDHFNPENFLDDGGNLINAQHLLSFSTGKRVCLGESLARQELLIFLVGLLQRFEFVEHESDPLPDVDECDEGNLSRPPRLFHVSARIRLTA